MVSMFAPGLAQKLYGLPAGVAGAPETHELCESFIVILDSRCLGKFQKMLQSPNNYIKQWRDLTIC